MHPLQVDADITVAKTLSKVFYLSENYFEQCRQGLFEKSWQFIGDTDLFQQNNCYPFTLLSPYLSEPLLLTKEADRIHCLSNVCTHRGNLLINEPCKTSSIRCKYHGRLFRHDGGFVSMPEFEEVKNFPTEKDNLSRLPLFQWGKFLFTSLHPSVAAEEVFSPIMQRLSWLPLDKFQLHKELNNEYYVDAHWALYCENYLEGFHIPFVHAGLNAVIDYGTYSTELFEWCNLQIGEAKKGEVSFSQPKDSPDYGRDIAAYYFWIFPNLMFNFYPWGLSINVVEPIRINKTRIRFITYIWKDELYDKGAGSGLDKVEMEDEEVVQNVQQGIRSMFYEHGRYSVKRETGIHHFHRLISKSFS